MEFSDRLNYYVDLLGCTSSSLSKASGVSLASISRYRSGERTPAADSPQVALLARGIASLSVESDDVAAFDEQDVYAKLSSDASGIAIDYAAFRYNLAALLDAIGFSNSELARAISYDPSYISRIITGSRRPADIAGFIDQVATAVGKRFGAPGRSAEIAQLIDRPISSLSSVEECAKAVRDWLSSNEGREGILANGLLHRIDSFDYEEFSQFLDLEGIELPPYPFQIPVTRNYTGIQQIMEAELDFIRATIASSSTDPVTIYSDMPVSELSDDPKFTKKWMHGMALMLEKGLHLNIIHDIHRPIDEMVEGVERWVPLYMTGQITPYYLEKPQGGVFKHNIKVSGDVALLGQAISGHQNEGSYLVTRSRDDVRSFSLRAKRLLEQAKPLVDIYRVNDRDEFEKFIMDAILTKGTRYAVLSTPPIQIIPDDLLERVLDSNNLDDDQRKLIFTHVARRKDEFKQFLMSGDFKVHLAQLAPEEFEQHPVTLSLSDAFSVHPVTYTYEQYREHIQAIVDFAKSHERYVLTLDGSPLFHNIQVVLNPGKWALISKQKSPVIHFVTKNPQLLSITEGFIRSMGD